jgi:phospholipase/lecithinase/hemolysin
MVRAFGRHWLAVLAFLLPAPAFSGLFDNVYVLGDSLSDQGNLFIGTAGIVSPANAAPASDHYFNGRFSNGPIYADVLAQALGVPLTPSLAGGNNFAFGGARTTYNISEAPFGPLPAGSLPSSLNREVGAFKSRNINDPNGLYIVFSGSNDIGDILALGMNPGVVIPTLLTGVLNAIEAFKDAGAQTVVVPNVPDLGRTPALLGNPNPAASALGTFFSAQYNAALHSALATVSGTHVIEFDTFGFLTELVTNPGAFGLTNVTTPCYSGFVDPNPAATECATPDMFAFWDRIHPTSRLHYFLGEALLRAVPAPSTLSLVLAVLLGVTGFSLWREIGRG